MIFVKIIKGTNIQRPINFITYGNNRNATQANVRTTIFGRSAQATVPSANFQLNDSSQFTTNDPRKYDELK